MLEIEINHNEFFAQDSEIISTKVGSSYAITTEAIGFRGKPLSAYFGVDILHNKTGKLDRRVVWLENISGKKEKITLNFTAPTDAIRIIYRINKETEKKSKCKYDLLPLDEISIVESPTQENQNTKKFFQERPKELSVDEESTFEKNLVWLMGFTRSGTTWLGTELLSYHTNIMKEPKFDQHIGSVLPLETLPTQMEEREHLTGYFFSLKYKNTWKFYLKKLILNRIYSQFQDLSKKIIIKEPTATSLGFSTIAECFPNSQLIWLLRDGRDVIDSQIDARTYGYSKGGRFENLIDKPLETKDRLKFIKNRANMWLRVIEQMQITFNNYPRDLKLLVNYEDLRKNTVKELQKIYRFLEIDISDEDVKSIVDKYAFESIPAEKKGIGKMRRTAIVGGWQKNFNDTEKDLLNSILGNMLTKLGYDA